MGGNSGGKSSDSSKVYAGSRGIIGSAAWKKDIEDRMKAQESDPDADADESDIDKRRSAIKKRNDMLKKQLQQEEFNGLKRGYGSPGGEIKSTLLGG